jgi:hypothetical protein
LVNTGRPAAPFDEVGGQCRKSQLAAEGCGDDKDRQCLQRCRHRTEGNGDLAGDRNQQAAEQDKRTIGGIARDNTFGGNGLCE